MDKYEIITTDVLVIGGGGAGVRAAIEADNRGVEVCLVSKGPISNSGLTPLAYPSIQAPFGTVDPRDNSDVHYDDIVKMGRYLCDQDLARVLADEIVDRIHDLDDYGVSFKKLEDGRFFQVHHPGQTYPRNLYLTKGGFGLIHGLKREVKKRKQIKILEDFCVSRLLKDQGEVVGAFGMYLRDGKFYAIMAKSTVLACGGYEEVWGLTDTAPDSTGDGVYLGYDAGADIVDMEMALYYPAAFAHPESVRGVLIQYETFLHRDKLDFRLVNTKGEQFVPDGPLPVRDVLSRLMFTEIEEGRGTEHYAVFVDPSLSSKTPEEIEECIQLLIHLPDRNLKSLGIDIRKDRLEISPAIHYTLGGVHINVKAEASLPGLYAAGENASNVHGANRISGNALAETQVFGQRAGWYAAEYAKGKSHGDFAAGQADDEFFRWQRFAEKKNGGVRAFTLKDEMKETMDRNMGPNRTESKMLIALDKILDLKQNGLPNVEVVPSELFNTDWRAAIELAITLDLAEITIRSALSRKESRGHHYRKDYPETLDTPEHTLVRKSGEEIVMGFKPVRTL